jgi:hypothetical protein
MGGAVRRGGVDCVRGQLDLLTCAGQGFECRVFTCGVHIEAASTSTQVSDHGLIMLLKLGVATETWNYSECFKGGVREQS